MKHVDSIGDILKAVLQQNPSLLGSRSQLENLLDEKVPGALERDAMAIKGALRENVGEVFLAAGDSFIERHAALLQAEAKLRESGLQERRIQFVLDTFMYALGWNDPASVGKDDTAAAAARCGDNGAPSAGEEPDTAVSAPAADVWQCSCGQQNTGKFCVGCGRGRLEPERPRAQYREPPPAVQPRPVQPVYTQSSAPAGEPGSQKFIIGLLVVVIAGLCFGGGYLLKGSFSPGSHPAAATKSSSSGSPKDSGTKKVVSDKELLFGYVSAKAQYDKEIAALATDINGYLSNHADFRGESTMAPRADNILKNIQEKRSKLGSEAVKDKAVQQKLDQVFEAEQQRVQGLADGIRASQQGQDYLVFFHKGTEAAYRYDDLDAELNRALEGLQ